MALSRDQEFTSLLGIENLGNRIVGCFFFPGVGGQEGGADILGLLKKKTHFFILGGDVNSWL